MELERRDMERAIQGLSLELSGRILESAMEGLFSDDEKARIVARGMQRIAQAGQPVRRLIDIALDADG